MSIEADGRAALARLESESTYTAIITDIAMPKMSGIDLFEEATRRWPELASRFCFVTGVRLDDETHARIAGCAALFTKPLDFARLDAWIRATQA